ncbi:hypothetical protein [Streptomyces hirsutus]|uniref:hypothetical protein n=1 Tax=Streptomyces hirsutus TaxID=35620 RepID=UPI0006E2F6A5|nr:hypothetical protein [Streptomyces hirsutus]
MIKNCSVCGTSFEPLKAHGEYCGKPCRDKAYRQRKGAERPSLARSATPGAPLPDDDREALRELYRAAIARIIADGIVVPGRRGEADVAHPLARFVGQWFSALGCSAKPADGNGDDLDALIAALLKNTDDKGQRI